MCQECWQSPCHPRCPNSEPQKMGICNQCGEELYAGYEIWTDFEENLYCSEKCVKDFYRIREIDY